jgi:hypothetical protein
MPLKTPARPGAQPRHRLQVWHLLLHALRAAIPYLLIAAALLAASEVIWLWHAWPVRQVLDREKQISGAPL